MLEYRMNGEEYRQKQRDFKIHDLKMRHIKQLVQEYDDVHYRSSASSSTSGRYRTSTGYERPDTAITGTGG